MLKRKTRIIFYYPQHFNRDTIKGNLLFDPFLRFCESNNYSYKLIEEPDKKSIVSPNPNAIKFNLFFVLFFRKLTPRILFNNFEKREQLIGRLYRFCTAGRYKADIIFTLSNSLGGFWRGYNPKARIIDYQHGLINNKHTGYFDKGKVPMHISYNNKEVAVWGVKFKQIFKQDSYYNDKVHVLGHYQTLKKMDVDVKGRNTILFMLQFMPDVGEELNTAMMSLLKDSLNQFRTIPKKERPVVLLKNHPRHNHIINLADVFKNYEFVHVLPDHASVEVRKVLISVTFFSTAAFEMAQKGVPSVFLFNDQVLQGYQVFYQDYNYPIQFEDNLLETWLVYQNNPNRWLDNSTTVKNWVHNFFQPFDNDVLSQILKKTYNER